MPMSSPNGCKRQLNLDKRTFAQLARLRVLACARLNVNVSASGLIRLAVNRLAAQAMQEWKNIDQMTPLDRLPLRREMMDAKKAHPVNPGDARLFSEEDLILALDWHGPEIRELVARLKAEEVTAWCEGQLNARPRPDSAVAALDQDDAVLMKERGV